MNSAEAPTDEEWDTYLQLCRRKATHESIGVLVVTAGGGPTPKQRMAIRELVREGPVQAAIVTDAPTVHGIITVLRWRNPGIRNFSHIDEALKYLAVGGSIADRVLLEIKAMQREVA